MENWEAALMQVSTGRVNRRATTDSVVRANTAFSIRVLEDGHGKYRSTWYYARHLNGGIVFTGRRSDGLALHLQNKEN